MLGTIIEQNGDGLLERLPHASGMANSTSMALSDNVAFTELLVCKN